MFYRSTIWATLHGEGERKGEREGQKLRRNGVEPHGYRSWHVSCSLLQFLTVWLVRGSSRDCVEIVKYGYSILKDWLNNPRTMFNAPAVVYVVRSPLNNGARSQNVISNAQVLASTLNL